MISLMHAGSNLGAIVASKQTAHQRRFPLPAAVTIDEALGHFVDQQLQELGRALLPNVRFEKKKRMRHKSCREESA